MTITSSKMSTRPPWRYLAVALIFLSAQLHGAVHAAEFGRDFHEHDGAPCAIQFLCETAKGLSVPPAVVAPALYWAGPASDRPIRAARPHAGPDDHHPIRGPPALLF